MSGDLKRVTRRVSHRKQELLILPEHLSSSPMFSGVRVARSLVFCALFCRSLFVLFFFRSLCSLSFFDLRLLISYLITSTFSSMERWWHWHMYDLVYFTIFSTLVLKLRKSKCHQIGNVSTLIVTRLFVCIENNNCKHECQCILL